MNQRVFAFCWEYPILLENNLKVNSVNIVKGSTIKTQEVKKNEKNWNNKG